MGTLSILTIAIPTYNRVLSLKKTLQLVIDWFYEENVEILISDNASTDGTKEYIQSLRRKYPKLAYYRNETNLGFDGNFLNCMMKATGKFLWMIGDDDYILSECKDWIFKTLEKNPVFVHLNTSRYCDGKIESPRYSCGDLYITRDRNDFLSRVGIYITFLSASIYRMDYIREIDDFEQYYKEGLLQSHVALKTMNHVGDYIIISQNCVAAKGNKTVSYDVYKTWIKEYGRVLLQTAIQCGFSHKIVHSILHNDYKTTILDFVLNFRKTCTNSSDWDKNCIWEYIKIFPDLVPLYRLAVNTPIDKLNEAVIKIQELRCKEMVDFCAKYNNIYIYGAGFVAGKICEILKKYQIAIKGALVTNDVKESEYLGGTINRISDMKLSEKDGVIVALKYEYQQEIKNIVESKFLIENIYWQDIYR